MYSENQAIQKKRDNVQTSALEWIINHLKALQNNIVNINNSVNSLMDRVILHETGPYEVIFPSTFDVYPSGFAVGGTQSANYAGLIYNATELTDYPVEYMVDDRIVGMFRPCVRYMQTIEQPGILPSIFKNIKACKYTSSQKHYRRFTIDGCTNDNHLEAALDYHNLVDHNADFTMDLGSGNTITITLAFSNIIERTWLFPPADNKTPVYFTFYYTNA